MNFYASILVRNDEIKIVNQYTYMIILVLRYLWMKNFTKQKYKAYALFNPSCCLFVKNKDFHSNKQDRQ